MVAKKAKVINAFNFTIVVGVHQNQNVKSNPMKWHKATEQIAKFAKIAPSVPGELDLTFSFQAQSYLFIFCHTTVFPSQVTANSTSTKVKTNSVD
jgi:hypothetical protein